MKSLLIAGLLVAGLVPLQAAGTENTLARSTSDRPDDRTGLQVHMIYALPRRHLLRRHRLLLRLRGAGFHE